MKKKINQTKMTIAKGLIRMTIQTNQFSCAFYKSKRVSHKKFTIFV